MLLALVTMALYWPALHCDFVNLDDDVNVTDNLHVQSGLNWEGIKWALGNTKQAAYWAPMMWLSHELTCQLFGLNPRGHHLINVLLHGANTVLVFVLLRRLTGAMGRSFFVAALFGLHPLHVESVAWVTERKDVLSALFGLLSLLFYVGYAQNRATLNPQRSTLDYILALLFFALGLMSKAMLVTWPFVMLLLDYWPLERVSSLKFSVSSSGLMPSPTLNSDQSRAGPQLSTLLLEKLPFLVLAVAASVVTYVVQGHGGTVMPIENLPLGARIANALVSYCRYLGKIFWPTNLAVFYPHPGHWPMEDVLLAGGLLLGITVLFTVARRRFPFLLMGWLWFGGTLVPVIQLVQSGEQAMADRFTYIPSLGVLILTVWGVHELTCRWRYHKVIWSLAGCAGIVLCMGVTRRQLGYWQDSEALFRHELAVTEDNCLAHVDLGTALDKKGRIDEAISQFRQAVRLNPNDDIANNNLGNDLLSQGQTDEAISRFEQAVRLNPRFAGFHYNLGLTLSLKGRIDKAIAQFQETIRLKPDYAEAHYYLGNAFLEKGQTAEAISQFQETLRLNPDDAEAHNNLGNALGVNGQTDEAILQFQEALRLKPDLAAARSNLTNALQIKSAAPSR